MAESVTIALRGRIDSTNAEQTENEILEQLSGKDGAAVVIDASSLEYISSIGLRILLRLKKAHPRMTVTEVCSEIYDILQMTGFTEILTVKKAYRVVSVEGCEVIGEGSNGRVYRIDNDNVVKTYKNADALSEIRHEREMARLALVLGVPTAISYDVVKVGDSYGTVFELLDARSFAGIIAEEPERIDWCVKEYVELLKKLHSTEVADGELPDIKKAYLTAVRNILPMLPAESGEKLLCMVEAIPDSKTLVHGDCHTKNIVLAGDEVLLIDMDTLSVGHPIFELAQMYNSYVGFGEYHPEVIARYQGFSADVARDFWNRTLRAYLNTSDDAAALTEKKIRCIAYIRLIDWSTRHHDMTDADDRATRELWVRELLSLLDEVDSPDFDVQGEDAPDAREIEVTAAVENLPEVTAFVEEALSGISCGYKTQMQIGIAVEEIFVNIAQYAYAPSTGTVRVRAELSDSPLALTITFTDSGVPYDPLAKPDPDVTLSAEERRIGGLGIFMTKKAMDEVAYRFEDGKNIFTMKKIL